MKRRLGVTIKLGYLLPTREHIMKGDSSAQSLLNGAKAAANFGFDSIWIGDSLLARPRHEPLTLLAAVASVVPKVEVGTAVLLPVLRNPIVLAHQLATLDQISEGRLIVGVGIAGDAPSVRSEFMSAGVPWEKRVGRLIESLRLCRALWTGEEVDWDGLWQVEKGVLAPLPYREGGPPFWMASGVAKGIARAARHCEGWFPIGPDAQTYREQRDLFIEQAASFGKTKDDVASALYLTIAINDDSEKADEAINDYLSNYYNIPGKSIRRVQACCGGSLEQVVRFIQDFVDAGAEHIVLRLVGDHVKTMQTLAKARDGIA